MTLLCEVGAELDAMPWDTNSKSETAGGGCVAARASIPETFFCHSLHQEPFVILSHSLPRYERLRSNLFPRVSRGEELGGVLGEAWVTPRNDPLRCAA